MSTVNIVFCGGAGSLIGRFLPEQLPAFCAKPTIHYLDTSESEKGFHRKDGKFTMFTDKAIKAGSGGLRDGKADLIKRYLPAFIVENPHADINILVVSISGASGAVISHLLAADMLREGKKVIVLASQSPTTYLRAANSLKSLMGYRMLASRFGNSVMGYVYDAKGNFEQADRYLAQDLTVLLHLFNGNIQGVDDSDLQVLLSPERLPDMDYAPDFYSINLLFTNTYGLENPPVSILTLSPAGGTDNIGSGAMANYSGIIDVEAYKKMYAVEDDGSEPVLSLAVFDTDLPAWISDLSVLIDRQKQKLSTRVATAATMPRHMTVQQPTGDDDLII